jgi:hypothetical protein
MKPGYELLLTRRAAHNGAGDNKPLYLDHAFRGVSRRSTQWIRKAGSTLSRLCAVSVRDLPIKNRTTGWPRPKNGRGSDTLANSGRVAQTSHHDLRKKENEPPSALPGRLRRNLLWRAKLADEPRRSPWQLQRINLIAFPAAKRPPPFAVCRHHQHHRGATVLTPLRLIGPAHAAV